MTRRWRCDCEGGPFDDHLVTVVDGQTRVLLQDDLGGRRPAWYRVEWEEGTGYPRVVFDPAPEGDNS